MGNTCTAANGATLLLPDHNGAYRYPGRRHDSDSTTQPITLAEMSLMIPEESAPRYSGGGGGSKNNNNNNNTIALKNTESDSKETTTTATTATTTDSPNASPKRNRRKPKLMFPLQQQQHHNSPIKVSNYNHVHNAVTMSFKEHSNERGDDQHPLGVVGLRNLGNTCFLNCSLQCLSATIPLTDYFLGYNYRSEINKDNPLGTGGKLVTAYGALIKGMWLGSNKILKPLTFKAQLERFAPQFKGTYQHDSQELLSFLLDGIHEDLNRIKKKPYIVDNDCDGNNDEQDAIDAWANYLRRDKSVVVDIFQGQLRNRLKCMTCGHKNIRFEPFMYLSLPISDNCKSLEDCLDLYLEKEFLSGKNRWYCVKCKKHRTTMKQTDIWVLPPILIVHLKRFKFNDSGRIGSKNKADIVYPVDNWDLSKFVRSTGGERYDLYAVSNHMGSLGGGHYTSVTLNRFDNNWYEYNDSQTCRVPKKMHKQLGSNAYVLFYNRCNEKKMKERTPLVRRQSESRPDLWPHQQVQRHQVRKFSRDANKGIDPPITLAEMAASVADMIPEDAVASSKKERSSTRSASKRSRRKHPSSLLEVDNEDEEVSER